jgi:hypothetical protein
MYNMPAYIHLPLGQESVLEYFTFHRRWRNATVLHPLKYLLRATRRRQFESRPPAMVSLVCSVRASRKCGSASITVYHIEYMGIRRLFLSKALSLLNLMALHFYCVISCFISVISFFTIVTNLGLLELTNMDLGMRRKA